MLKRLLKDLHSVAVNYKIFGIQLGVEKKRIDTWELEQQKKPGLIFIEILDFWLNNYQGKSQRDELCQALESINELVLAEDIKKKYIQELGMKWFLFP